MRTGNRAWRNAVGRPGTCLRVSAGASPSRVSSQRKSTSETLRRAVPLPDSVWAPGMPCSFATGAFRDQQAVLVAIGGGVATVALPMLGELRELTVPIDRLVLRQACQAPRAPTSRGSRLAKIPASPKPVGTVLTFTLGDLLVSQ
jgi:hypothetical protein